MANRFLVVQLADIGDLILSTPALSALREAHPDAHIALLTTTHAAPIITDTQFVDEIITFDRQAFNSSYAFFKPNNLRRVLALRAGRYDTVVFFHHFTLKLGTLKFALIALASGAKRRIGLENGNGWFLTDRLTDEGFGAKHQAQYWLDLVAHLGANPIPRTAAVNRQSPKPALSTQHSVPQVVIHPGSGGYSRARRWEPTHFATVADTLHREFNAQIILVGGKGDDTEAVKAVMQHQPLDFTAQTTLPELAEIIQQADLFIGADSGVMHIAAALGTPVIAVFGPSNPDAWGAWTPNGTSIIVRSAPECSPCSYVEHSIGLREGCPARTCMRMVTPEHVLTAARQILNKQPIPPASKSLPKSTRPNRIHILGLPVDSITYAELLNLIDNWISASLSPQSSVLSPQSLTPNSVLSTQYSVLPHHICTLNPEFTMIAQRDSNFHNILKRADLCVPDGVGLLWAAQYQGTPLPERVTGSDGVPIIATRAAEKGWRLFLLGAAPGVAQKAADVLRARHPALQIVGVYSGSPAPEEEDSIVERINTSNADILFVAYGAPEQDKWIARNTPRLRVKMAMGVGGAFDFIAGIIPRAPLWMQRFGLEWLFRLYLQPWRIRRMMRLPRFVIAVLLDNLFK